MKTASITLEDRFVSATASTLGQGVAAVWRVVRLFEGGDGVRYAGLVNVADHTLTKTVATDALLDRALFRQAG